MQTRLRHSAIRIPFHRGSSVASPWTTYTSGLTKYRRGLSDGLYVLDYSSDGGVTWETILSIVPTEDSIIIDATNLYRHRIVGTAYRVDRTLTPIGYAGAEDTDWENIYTT